MGRSRLAIIIPAFNEGRTIAEVVTRTKAFGTPFVIDDCSHDRTAELARNAGAIVVSHTVNRGYDGALNTGFAVASEQDFWAAITLDADGQHNPGLIDDFSTALEGGADVVVGIRPQKARIAEFIFGCFTNILYGIKDPLCGMKAYRLSVFRQLGHFDSYRSIGTELAIYAAKNGYRIEQRDIPISERADQPRFGSGLKANLKILRAMLLSLSKVKRKTAK